MKFKKERRLLKEVNRSVDLMESINYEVAEYVNERIKLKAFGNEGEFKAKITTTNHNEYVFVEVEFDRNVYFKKTYYPDMDKIQSLYKKGIIKELLNEIDFFTEENYKKFKNEDEYDENFWLLQDSYITYIIKVFGEKYIDYIKNLIKNEYWEMEIKKENLNDTDWDYKVLLPEIEDIFEKKEK